jgi:GNAT superfamily N-acetyltransferase
MELVVVTTDADYESWREVRIAVLPYERCPSVEELKEQTRTPGRLMLVAREDGVVLGSGLAGRADSGRRGFVAPRVVPAHRRQGLGTALLDRLVDHVGTLDVEAVQASTDDEGSLAFALHHGFEAIDQQVEQLRSVGDEPDPGPPPGGLHVVTGAERPGLWAACYDYFGREVMADFALVNPLDVDARRWADDWAADPMFLALDGDRVVGCAGFYLDSDQPDRAENALTAVARSHRGRGLASHLKRRTLRWAAEHGIREVYTWTQDGNADMRRLNEHLGYRAGLTSTTVSRPLGERPSPSY